MSYEPFEYSGMFRLHLTVRRAFDTKWVVLGILPCESAAADYPMLFRLLFGYHQRCTLDALQMYQAAATNNLFHPD